MANVSFKYCFYFSVLIALLPSAVVLFLSAGSPAEYFAGSGGFATLAIDEDISEAEVGEALLRGGMKHFISAATESAFLNVFSHVEALPLADYFNHIEDYDLRNDGYAEQALKIFVSEGKRRIFIPAGELGAHSAGGGKIARALDGIPYDLIVPQYVRSPLPALLLFAFALLLFALLIRIIVRITGDKYLAYYAAAFIPPFAILGRTGGGGLAACAVLLALFQILRAPFLRFFTSLRFRQAVRENLEAPYRAFIPVPSPLYLAYKELGGEIIATAVFFALYLAIVTAAKISPASAFWAFFFFIASFVAFSFTESLRSRIPGHVRFIFIPIHSRHYGVKKFPTLPLPFICAAFVSLFVSLFAQDGLAESKPAVFMKKEAVALDLADYEKHLLFQQDFAYRKLTPLGTAASSELFLHYTVGDDGLIESSAPAGDSILDFPDSAVFEGAPAWTLEPLVAFLNGSRSGVSFIPHSGAAGGAIAFLMAVCLYVPFAVRRHRKKTSLLLYN